MRIMTSRFGEIEVDEKKIIHFKRGILGFPSYKNYALLDPNAGSPLKWLQSIDEPKLAFVITEPSLFIQDYQIDIHKSELEDLETEILDNIIHFVIVTVPSDPSKMTA
ncbi:MAG: flagellar assembly protein FliW, partial [Candidatus Cloacimonetes bacterium]|nr:flagellar assembly protein FliW [Candidatus Cloacimonadota bacterium]